jgi:spermidine synthase
LKTRWFLLFFFVSGFCSLVYELVWLRLSMARFGVTTPMVSIVLSVFMAGLGLGSWAGGALVSRLKGRTVTPLRLYGALELLIGVSAFAAPLMLEAGYRLLRDAGEGLAWGSAAYHLASGACAAVALLPWTTCMGATFPFAMAAIRALHPKESPRSFSYLYLANVLGAVTGTLVPALLLIEAFGFRSTLSIASALNIAMAAGVFLLSLSARPAAAEAEEHAPEGAAAPAGAGTLWLLFTTGICSMAMEVVWIRQFTIYLGNVVYAFAAILAIYLLATCAGSLTYRRRTRSSNGLSDAAWALTGGVALLPLVFADPRLTLLSGSVYLSFGYEALRAALGIAPFSALAGYLTPMLVDRWSGGDPARAGRAYGVNVLGSILGPLIAGFCAIPLAGERGALCVIAAPLFAIGCRYALKSARSGMRTLYAGSLAFSILAIFLTRGFESGFSKRVELRDSTATVIATGEGRQRQLKVNGIGMTWLTTDTKMMAHLLMAMHPRRAENGLVICFGMGTSFRSMLSWGIPVTAVELVPSVPKLFGYYHADAGELLRSPLARVAIDDGRRFLERSPERFSVILVDPPPPLSAPTSSLLYSQEFYRVLKAHLRPGGVVQIWCPYGEPAAMAAIAKSLAVSFPTVRAFRAVEQSGIHFIAGNEPLPATDARSVAERLPARASADLLEWMPGATTEQLLASVLGAGVPLQDLIAPAPRIPPVTDDRPVNEYFLLRNVTRRLARQGGL